MSQLILATASGSGLCTPKSSSEADGSQPGASGMEERGLALFSSQVVTEVNS